MQGAWNGFQIWTETLERRNGLRLPGKRVLSVFLGETCTDGLRQQRANMRLLKYLFVLVSTMSLPKYATLQ